MKQGILAAAIAAVTAAPFVAAAQTPPPAPCTPSGGLSFVCGIQNGEDLVLVPETRWLIASGMAPGSGLHAVDTQAKTLRKLYAAGTAAVTRPTARRTRTVRRRSIPSRWCCTDSACGRRRGRPLHPCMPPTTAAASRSRCSSWTPAARRPPRRGSAACSCPNGMARQQRGGVQRPVARGHRAHHAGQDVRGRLRAAQHRRGVRVEAGREDVPDVAGHGALGQQRHRDVARRSGVLRRVHDHEARVAYSRAKPGVVLRTAQLKEFGPDNVRWAGNGADHGRDDRQRAVVRRAAEDRGRHPLPARLRGDGDRSEDDGGDRARARPGHAGVHRHRDGGAASATSCGSGRSSPIAWPTASLK